MSDIMKQIYQSLILCLFYICNSFAATPESPQYTIKVLSEVFPKIQDNRLDLCRTTKELDPNQELLIQTDNIKTCSNLIYYLLSNHGSNELLDILIDNFIRATFQLPVNKDLLAMMSFLINISTTDPEKISRKLISTYETQEAPSDVYPIQLFKMTDTRGEDITANLAGILNISNLAQRVKAFREKIPVNIFPEGEAALIEYQNSIINLNYDIVKNKNFIFNNITYTKINYYMEYTIDYINKIVIEKADQIIRFGEISVLATPITFEGIYPLIVNNNYTQEQISWVREWKNKISEDKKSLNDKILNTLRLLTDETDKYNFVGYIQLLQLLISNPYR